MDKNNSATPPGHVRKLNNMQEATKEYYKVRLYLKILAMSFFFFETVNFSFVYNNCSKEYFSVP